MKKIRLLAIVVFGFIISIFSGASNWVLINSTDSKSASSDSTHTVTVYYKTVEDKYVWTDVNEETQIGETQTISGYYNSTAYNYYNNYNVGDHFDETTITEKTVIYKTYKKLLSENSSWGKYTVSYAEYKLVLKTAEYSRVTDETYSVSKTILVKNGSKINPIDIKTDYQNCGFYTSSSYSEFFDFTAPITSDKTIYIKYFKSSESLSNKITNLTGTMNLFNSHLGGSSGTDDLYSEDGISYDTNSNTAFLGATTIQSGATVNFTYGANLVNLEPYTGAVPYDEIANHRNTGDSYVATEVTNTASTPNSCALRVKLTGDMTVNGSLTIGAKIGDGNSFINSYIIGEYTELDLNGHTLTINNGGLVTAFGVISDTIGTGGIVVKNGGRLYSTFTLYDTRGGNQSTFGYSKGQCPFTHYSTPYIKCKMSFEYGSTFDGYVKFDLGSLGITNTSVSLLSLNDNSIFKWNSNNSNGKVTVTPYIVSALYNSNHYYNNDTKQYYYRRYKIDVDGDINVMNAKLSANINIKKSIGSYDIEINKSFDIYLGRTGLPISPVFDICVKKGSNVYVPIEVNFYPGSSLKTEKGSNIHFTKIGSFTYDSVNVSYKVVLVTVVSKTIPGETKYLCGQIRSYSYNFSTYSGYTLTSLPGGIYTGSNNTFKYLKPNNIFIDGNITFDTSIDTNSGKYMISGPINLCNEAMNTVINNKAYLQSYGIKGEQYGSVWFNGNTITEHNNNNSYVLVSTYNCLPLISYGKAYILDSSRHIEGTYNTLTNIFSANNGKKYFLKVSDNVLQGGTGTSYQDNAVDRDVTPTEATSVSNYGRVSDGTNQYVSFCGVFVLVESVTSDTQVTVSSKKFNSNPDSSLLKDSNKNPTYPTSITLTYQSSSGLWKKS